MSRHLLSGCHRATGDAYVKDGLLAIASHRFRAFEAKFGRSPKPDEPIFFDESKSAPTKASLADTRAQLEEGARAAGVRLDPILRFLRLAPAEATSKAGSLRTGCRDRLQPYRAARNESRGSYGWRQFLADKRLHRRHGITHTELSALSQVALLGKARSARDYISILEIIRKNNEN